MTGVFIVLTLSFFVAAIIGMTVMLFWVTFFQETATDSVDANTKQFEITMDKDKKRLNKIYELQDKS